MCSLSEINKYNRRGRTEREGGRGGEVEGDREAGEHNHELCCSPGKFMFEGAEVLTEEGRPTHNTGKQRKHMCLSDPKRAE